MSNTILSYCYEIIVKITREYCIVKNSEQKEKKNVESRDGKLGKAGGGGL